MAGVAIDKLVKEVDESEEEGDKKELKDIEVHDEDGEEEESDDDDA